MDRLTGVSRFFCLLVSGPGQARSWSRLSTRSGLNLLGSNVMVKIGTPNSASATRVLLCGGGELGKEVVIELQRLGVEVIVLDLSLIHI